MGTAFALSGALQGRPAGPGEQTRIPPDAVIARAGALVDEVRRLGRIPAGARPAILPALYVVREAAAAGRDGTAPPAGAALMPLRLWWAALRGRV